jgi:hypothetical protein
MLRLDPYFQVFIPAQVIPLFISLTSYIQIIIANSFHFNYSSKSCKQLIIAKHKHNPMITMNPSSSVIIYMMTITNKRLLISETHDNSNRYSPCKGKPDQQATHFPRSVRVWCKTIHISCGPHIATLRETPTDLDRSHCSQEKRAPDTVHSMLADRSTGSYPVSLSSKPMKLGHKTCSYL